MPQVVASDTLTVYIFQENRLKSMTYNATSYGILGFLVFFLFLFTFCSKKSIFQGAMPLPPPPVLYVFMDKYTD